MSVSYFPAVRLNVAVANVRGLQGVNTESLTHLWVKVGVIPNYEGEGDFGFLPAA